MWQAPSLSLKWGEYFRPDADDMSKLVALTIQAEQAGVITLRSAVQKLQRTFAIENVDQYVDALESEREKKRAEALETMQATKVESSKEEDPPSNPKDAPEEDESSNEDPET